MLNDNFFVVKGRINAIDVDGNEGYNVTGYVGGEEVTVFADRNDTEVIDATYNGSYAEPTFTTASNTADVLSKGDILLYSQRNGKVDKIYRLVYAWNLKDSSQPGGLTFSIGNGVKLATFEVGGNDYSFYYGFAYDKSGNTLKLSDNKEGNDAVNLSLKPDVSGASVDFFVSKIKVSPATSGDINADKTGEGKGDVVFVRTLNDTIVEDFVVFKANN